ncbi:MAG TPA: hypothetical protein VLX29_03245 [Nitrospirota bacterium]|nr:hypothetical protein [Nitrospirota bacterium]
MKQVIIGFSIVMLFCHGVAYACTIENAQKTEIGDNRGIEGICSNSEENISCEYVTGEGVKCDGPEGSFSGADLSNVIFSACGCSYAQMPEVQIENELKQNKQ